MNPLDALADLASIVTAAVAVVAAGWYWCGRKRRQGDLKTTCGKLYRLLQKACLSRG
jgi:hypothetical protein